MKKKLHSLYLRMKRKKPNQKLSILMPRLNSLLRWMMGMKEKNRQRRRKLHLSVKEGRGEARRRTRREAEEENLHLRDPHLLPPQTQPATKTERSAEDPKRTMRIKAHRVAERKAYFWTLSPFEIFRLEFFADGLRSPAAKTICGPIFFVPPNRKILFILLFCFRHRSRNTPQLPPHHLAARRSSK